MKIAFLFFLFLLTVRLTAQIVNGWEVLPGIDINGNWFFDKENTFSRLGAGFQTFTISGNTHLIGNYNQVKADNLKNFSNILSVENRKVKKFIGFRYRISKIVGNVSEVFILIGVQDNFTYISHNSMGEDIKNPIVSSEWREVKFDTKEILSYLTSFTKLRFETWVISPQTGYVSASFDVQLLFGEDSLVARTVYDKFDITNVPRGISIPTGFILEQNYPNPFNPTTKIEFSVPTSSQVSLKVYDLLGREVSTLVNEYKIAGNYEVVFNASNLPSGMYIYRLQCQNINLVKKMMLIK
jgi:hypothetical protein